MKKSTDEKLWSHMASLCGVKVEDVLHKRDHGAEEKKMQMWVVPSGGESGNVIWDRLWVENHRDGPVVYNEINELVVDVPSIPDYCLALMAIYEKYEGDKR